MSWFEHWRERRVLRRHALDPVIWRQVVAELPILGGLSADEVMRLRRLTTLFLHNKALDPVRGLTLKDIDRVRLAAQACLPILALGLDWYRGWSVVVLYPYDFISAHPDIDDAGVVHVQESLMTGESWERGPVILSFPAVCEAGQCDGENVVIHELAHKLDMLNGEANGYPPLHRDMSSATWSHVFQSAYNDLSERIDSRIRVRIDSYAAESPAECFAVFSEYFFSCPRLLYGEYPQVYEQLRQFYRQHPLARLYPAAVDSVVD